MFSDSLTSRAGIPEALQRLEEMVSLLNTHFLSFSPTELEEASAPGKWSRKQLLGHLLDSAANNHRRFVLCQTEDGPHRMVAYQQDDWVRLGAYQATPAADLLTFWTLYNQQLMRLIAQIPAEALSNQVIFENGYTVTLGWLIEDYAMHLEHHVRQILQQ
ncbi:DinB family protein [Hymenobacter lutimineralis]|uniref:DinB family protein n=1 Tax=Hymenobacter lutimineralis TaxID=2606448 RepID=A0A5D6V2V3_9BACT|nr:DinB family protein [Hymenobacter lutimineralis]TYZ09342.1 DinB family protein [Hymenobacter lutimineralis]